MNEIEVKILQINRQKIREKLTSMAAVCVKKEFQKNFMFDYEDNRFFQKGGYVRIRNLTDINNNREKTLVTFKELISKDKYKISKEIEFNSDNFLTTKEFLESLGLILFRVDEKIRESYKFDEGLIEIDTWAGVPSYLEVEADTEEKVVKLIHKIGYTLEQSTSMLLKEILDHYGLSDENRIFSEEEKNFLLSEMNGK